MNLLFIDHEDSFSMNIIHSLAANDAQVTSVKVKMGECPVAKIGPAKLGSFDGIVLSAGPGCAADYKYDVFFEALEKLSSDFGQTMPLLGVCLGHQILLGNAGLVSKERQESFFHGQVDGISSREALPFPFHEISPKNSVIFYNSLAVLMPTEAENEWTLVPSCSTPWSVSLACHTKKPWFGLQFHPESFASPCGPEFLRCFIKRCSMDRPSCTAKSH